MSAVRNTGGRSGTQGLEEPRDFDAGDFKFNSLYHKTNLHASSLYPSLGEEDGTEGPMIIEAEIGGHFAPARNKKPDDSSYHITHRIQWRNHLADRPDITTSKDRQKKRGQAPERNKAIQEEVEKLVDAGIMKEVHYHSWLSNPEGMFLGYKVNADWMKVCPDKADVVLSLPSLGCLKDVQKLNGKLATLNRFLLKSAEKSLPFFKNKKKPEECTRKSEFPDDFRNRIPLQTDEKLIAYHQCDRPQPRISIKGQILADFIMERPEEESPYELMTKPEELPESWTLFTDGSSYIDGFGAGLILTNLEGVKFTYAMRFRFEATNNEAEYEALIAGLRIAEQMGVKNLQANVDSRLVANQVNGSYVAKESGMVQYLEKVKTLTSSFKEFSIKQVPRSENKKADALSKIASTSFAHLSKQVLVEELNEKSINEKEVLAIVEEEGHTWMTPICEYLTKEILPKDKKKARVVRHKASRYAVINRNLYKKSFLGPWLGCVGPLQANYVLREIHKGSCSLHSGPRSVVTMAIRTGYYWLTMHTDAQKPIRECNDCQVHRPIPRNL
ncbi:reverse transcriptase domain-containing protein [Tanacetum coccineum]